MTMRGTTTTLLGYTLFLTGKSNAAISPATSNCVDQNFTDATVYEPDGGQYGICIFSNTTACEEWTFLRGECDTSHLNFDSFCSENGGQVTQEDVDWGEVEGAPAAQYDVCTVDGVMCTDYEYYALNGCEFAAAAAEVDDGCAVKGGTSRVMGTIAGSDYTLCFFGNANACELEKLMSGECDETNPSLISFCAELGGSMSLGGVEPLEYEVCTVGELTCIEEDYYLNGNCAMMKEGDLSSGVVTPPDNDECLNATVISTENIGQVQNGSVTGATLDEWSIACSFLQVPPGKGVWYVIKGIEAGTNLKVTCTYMECMLMTIDPAFGECPSMFTCADASVGGDNNTIRYQFTTEEEGIYYVYIAPKQFVPGPLYTLVVEEIAPPTPAPTELLTSPPVPTAAAGRTGLGALFNIGMFAAFYFMA